MEYTANKKTGSQRAIVFVLFGVLALGSMIFPIPAKAENNYIDTAKFFFDSETNSYAFSFFTKTTFQAPSCYSNNALLNNYYDGMFYCGWDTNPLELWISPNLTDGNFIAGNTYKISGHIEGFQTSTYILPLTKSGVLSSSWLGRYLNTSDFLTLKPGSFFPSGDDVIIYFTEIPNLDVSFPFEGSEISGAFNIQGSYTLPASSTYDRLRANLLPLNPPANYFFDIQVAPPGENFEIPISGIPAGSYAIAFYFYDNTTGYSFDLPGILNISILDAIPYELPGTGEQIPVSYTGTDPLNLYPTISSYATPTALYIKMTGVVSPLINSIGENLNFFSGKFTQENAIETGQNIGGSILLARAYVGNINSFFNDFPVANLFLLFLLVMVGVIVFRLVKGLIGLIKL